MFLGPLMILFFPDGSMEWGAKAAVRKGFALLSLGVEWLLCWKNHCLFALSAPPRPCSLPWESELCTPLADFLVIGFGSGLVNEEGVARHPREAGQGGWTT